jgi:MoxR-like ATPase
VRDLARDVLRHRIVLSYEALAEDLSADDLLTPILEAVPVPAAPLRDRAAGFGGRSEGGSGGGVGGGDVTWARPPR